MNDSLVEEQGAAQGPAHALSLAAPCQGTAAQVWAGWRCQSQMGVVCPSQGIREGLGWMCCCSSWGQQVGCAGAVGPGDPCWKGAERGRMTLLTPCCFTERAPAPGGLLEIVQPLDGGTGWQLGLLQLRCLVTGWDAVGAPWHGLWRAASGLSTETSCRASAQLSWACCGGLDNGETLLAGGGTGKGLWLSGWSRRVW